MRKLRFKTLPGALEADLIAHWCQHQVYFNAKLKPPQPSHSCQLHILIPSGFITEITFKDKGDSYKLLPAPIARVETLHPSSLPELIWLQATAARLCEGIWMALAPGCCHGVDLFTVHQPTDFKQRTTRFGCRISVSVIIQRTHFHWVIWKI